MMPINKNNKVITRKCRCCSFEEKIEFYQLHFDAELDKNYFNCHHVHQCSECKNYYDIVMEPDEFNSSYEYGEQIIVEIINYREHEDLLWRYKNKV